ncbi:MAG: hypothetical protein JG761_1263 [Proteiniphilum sp.]|nr:hypothetical protein [Proteiniphilum sp.]
MLNGYLRLATANIQKRGVASARFCDKLSTIDSIFHWVRNFNQRSDFTKKTGGKFHRFTRSAEWVIIYLAIRSSHLSIASMVNMEIRQAATKTIQVAVIEMEV